jgi:hypothetical protein
MDKFLVIEDYSVQKEKNSSDEEFEEFDVISPGIQDNQPTANDLSSYKTTVMGFASQFSSHFFPQVMTLIEQFPKLSAETIVSVVLEKAGNLVDSLKSLQEAALQYREILTPKNSGFNVYLQNKRWDGEKTILIHPGINWASFVAEVNKLSEMIGVSLAEAQFINPRGTSIADLTQIQPGEIITIIEKADSKSLTPSPQKKRKYCFFILI